MQTYFRKLGAGLAGILNFNGRMALHDFWPYAITLGLALYLIGSLISLWLYFDIGQRTGLFDLGQSAAMNRGYDALQADEVLAIMQPFFDLIVPFAAISMAAHVILLAAAIVRRLHDTGRTGLWALLPLPFFVLQVVSLDRLFARLPQMMTVDPSNPMIFAFVLDVMWGALAALLGFAAVIVLIILLCGRGTPEANRFGEPPVPIV